VVNEAMACGLPVLVSKQSGAAGELVKNGENGFIFDAFDSISLSDLMFQFSSGHYDIKSFSRSSQEIIKNWGIERFGEGIFSAIICSKSRKGL
jgi:1,2-diacylglycerol 3-alpha-glucosyltransferase